MPEDTTYNGWKNYRTWNVALWLNNDEYLYNAVSDFMQNHDTDNWSDLKIYNTFLDEYGLSDSSTRDGVPFVHNEIDVPEIIAGCFRE